MKKSMIKNGPGLLFVLAVVLSTAVLSSLFLERSSFAASPSPKIRYDVLTLSVNKPAEHLTRNTIQLSICSGASGAPAGFSVQWMKAADYYGKMDYNPATDVGIWNNDFACHASFSGNANESDWDLVEAGQCVDVVIGGLNDSDPGVSFTCSGPLECGTGYVFRSFAHGTRNAQRSAFSEPVYFETAACQPTSLSDCDFTTKSQGFFGGNGGPGLALLLELFGGDGGTGDVAVNQGIGNLIALGHPDGFEYRWTLTGTYTDVGKGQNHQWVDNGLLSLRSAIASGGSSGQFSASLLNPTAMGSGGNLASQTAALTLNVMISGLNPEFPAGYGDLILFFNEGDTFENDGKDLTANQAALLTGETIYDVIQKTNAYLGGGELPFDLDGPGDLTQLISQLNLTFHGNETNPLCGISAFAQSHLFRNLP